MKNYLITDDENVKFSIETDIPNMEQIFKMYLNPYLYCCKDAETCDNHFMLLKDKNNNYSNIPFISNGDYLYYNNVILFNNDSAVLEKNAKRIISDLYCKILENKNGVFLHGSAVAYDEKAYVFIGDKGTGKTFNMIKELLNKQCKFISNDKIFLYKVNDHYYVRGFPSSIGIRKKNILYFNELSFLESNLDQKSIINEKDSCYDKITISVNQLCSSLNVDILPRALLKEINILTFSENNIYEKKLVPPSKIENSINQFVIDGVYAEQEFINEIIKNDRDNMKFKLTDLPIYNTKQVRKNIEIDKNKVKIKKLGECYE